MKYNKENAELIQADLKRIDSKIDNLKDLLFDYTKEKFVQYEEINDFMHNFRNYFSYCTANNTQLADSNIVQLIHVESIIDRITIELKEKELIKKIRKQLYLVEQAIDCGVRSGNLRILDGIKGDVKNILSLIEMIEKAKNV